MEPEELSSKLLSYSSSRRRKKNFEKETDFLQERSFFPILRYNCQDRSRRVFRGHWDDCSTKRKKHLPVRRAITFASPDGLIFSSFLLSFSSRLPSPPLLCFCLLVLSLSWLPNEKRTGVLLILLPSPSSDLPSSLVPVSSFPLLPSSLYTLFTRSAPVGLHNDIPLETLT